VTKQTDAVTVLQAFVDRHGSQKAAAEALGVSSVYIHDLLHGKRRFSDRILEALGLQRIVIQRKASRVA